MKLSQALPQEISLQLSDGKTYQFSDFHLNAQAAVEERYGISLTGDEGMNNDLGTFLAASMPKPSVMRFVAWQLLRKHHRDLGEEDVGFLITLENQTDVLKTITLSIVNSLPIPDAKKKEMAVEMEEKVQAAKDSLRIIGP